MCRLEIFACPDTRSLSLWHPNGKLSSRAEINTASSHWTGLGSKIITAAFINVGPLCLSKFLSEFSEKSLYSNVVSLPGLETVSEDKDAKWRKEKIMGKNVYHHSPLC